MISIKSNITGRKEQRFWNNMAKGYDIFIKKRADDEYEIIYQKILQDIKSSDNVLEMATGTGEIAIRVGSKADSVTAIDFAEKMIDLARIKAIENEINNISFLLSDCCEVQFEDKTFDKVICSNALHLMLNPELALKEMHRVLKDDGQIIIPTYCHGESINSRILSYMMRIFGFNTHNRWSAKSFKKFVTDNGFRVNEFDIIGGTIPFTFIRAVKALN